MHKWVALAGCLSLAQPALASDKEDFSNCDGRIHPGKQDDGMRGEASVSRFGGGLPLSMRGIDLAALGIEPPPGRRIDACTRALASERLKPTQTLRRAHLLRARASAQLFARKPDLALADLDAADAAVAALKDDRFYNRSMGASILLLRALAKVQQGDEVAAGELANAALEARPWSLKIQSAAAQIVQASRPLGVSSPSPWSRLIQLEPRSVTMAIAAEAQIGNHSEVLRLHPLATVEWPAPVNPAAAPAKPAAPPLSLMNLVPSLDLTLYSALQVSYQAAVAKAATGDVAGAKADLAALRTRIDELRPPPVQPPETVALPGKTESDAAAPAATVAVTRPVREDVVRQMAAQRERQLAARIALAEGRLDEVRKAVDGGSLPIDATTLALLDALQAPPPVPVATRPALTKAAAHKAKPAEPAPPPPPAVKPVDSKPARDAFVTNRKNGLRTLADDVLIAPETPRTVIDYEKSRPNLLGALVNGAVTMGFGLLGGIDRTDGFKSTANPDGTTKVEYTGQTPSEPMVQEMTLLRAAEIARSQSKWGFEIMSRNDYSRYWVTSQHGMEISRVPSGYKTELTIRLLDQPAEPGRALDAVALIDALGPFYYSEKSKK